MGQSQTEPYYQSVAITIIVFNAISLLSLSFVLGIYIANWKKIASFPMRLVLYLSHIFSHFIFALHVSSKISMLSFSTLFLFMIYKLIMVSIRQVDIVNFKLFLKLLSIYLPLFGQLWLFILSMHQLLGKLVLILISTFI